MTNQDSVLKSRDGHFADKGLASQSYDFSSSHVWLSELDHKECAEELMFLNGGTGKHT